MTHVPDDVIYTSHTLHSIPHRIRVKRVIAELRRIVIPGLRYADIGCGGGSVTQQIVHAIQPSTAVAYDFNAELVALAAKSFPGISFRLWNVTAKETLGEKYELVTCLETLEHIEDLKSALANLLKMTRGILFITVPVELGVVGTAKFLAKQFLGRETLTEEHSGSSFSYLKALMTGRDISQFRVTSKNGHWVHHTGFDYRKIDRFLDSQGVSFVAKNRGWNRFYRISVP